MIQSAVQSDRLEVRSFEGLLVDYAREIDARIILRGLRALSDFEFEFQLAHMNRRLGAKNPGGIETIFMMTGEEHFYVSSSLVREIASFALIPSVAAILMVPSSSISIVVPVSSVN